MHNKFNNINDEVLDVEEDTLKDKYLTFYTDNQVFGIPIADVIQIIGVQEITPVPDFPDYAKGIINLRGTIIPVIDIRLRFKKKEALVNDRSCIIVTDVNGINIGFIVESVSDVLNIDKSVISDPPDVGLNYMNIFILGVLNIKDRVILLLDTQKILNEKEIELVTNFSERQ